MYKEVVSERKIVAFIISFLVITIALYLNSFMKVTIGENEELTKYFTFGLVLLVIIILGIEIKRCRICYKYSLISDKLIINRIALKNEENLDTISLNVRDILYIGNIGDIPMKYCKCKCTKYHARDLVNNKKLCCVYNNNGRLESFIFKPSEKLTTRINSKIKVKV